MVDDLHLGPTGIGIIITYLCPRVLTGSTEDNKMVDDLYPMPLTGPTGNGIIITHLYPRLLMGPTEANMMVTHSLP